ncbi:MAG: alternate F1F0 ATPase, F1 subunit alpha [Candidatus Sumerlaeota bacterium]
MSPDIADNPFGSLIGKLDQAWDDALEQSEGRVHVGEVGTVQTVQAGVAIVDGLPGVKSEELVEFPGQRLGMAFDLTPDALGVILLDPSTEIEAGHPARRTHRVMDIPVGDAIIGRVVDAVGRPRDDRGNISSTERRPVEREAPAVLDRAPVAVPLQTGIKVVDALVPIGRGQRELIVGDRQTGKTSIAIDAILNQARSEVLCIYCAIGQRSSSVAGVLQTLRESGAMEYSCVIVATGDDPAGLRWAAPYSAMSVGEYFMEKGRDVLVVIDDLTRHARSYRELSLLLRRPPGREAYPGDIFYVHSRLLERAARLREEHGGGSLTALPIIETQAQNISAYIPTNLISITDGQVYLSPNLYQQGQLPAVDVGRSVSRVGGKAQLKAFRETSGDLRLSYSQFEELERFSRYGTRLQEQQRKQLEHGRRVRQVLRQHEHDTRTVMEQIAILYIVTVGLLDEVPTEQIRAVEKEIRNTVEKQMTDTAERIADGESLSDEDKESLKNIAAECIKSVTGKEVETDDEEDSED